MKRIIFLLVIGLLIGNICWAGYMKLPTQEELNKYALGVKLKVDNDIHYFSFFSVKELSDENGLVLVYGKDKTNTIKKEDILNWEDVKNSYQNKVLELGGLK